MSITATPAAASEAPVLFCKDCRHFNNKHVDHPARCAAPGALLIDLVYGPVPRYCKTVREARGACGFDALLFVARPAGDLAPVDREPYSGLSSAPSASNRSSLSMMNRASSDSATMTAATASAEVPDPNTDSHIARAVSSRS
jgi:hypothetical protein